MRVLGVVFMVGLIGCSASAADSQPNQATAQPVLGGGQPIIGGQTFGGAQAVQQAPSPKTLRDTYTDNSKYVVQIACPTTQGLSAGSGFIHKSGLVITAAHVIDGCKATDIIMLVKSSKRVNVTAVVATDVDNDLALLRPKERLEAGLSIVDDKALVAIGDTVAFIGYPGGYEGAMPMLGVGHIAAVGPHPSVKPGKQVVRGFVNGAFNRGNSGGPVIDLQTQTVVGVVHAKVAPMPADVHAALNALKNQNSGFIYTVKVGGKQFNVTEAQVVESVLEHFKNQVQLVVGVMILPEHIRKFLSAQKIKP